MIVLRTTTRKGEMGCGEWLHPETLAKTRTADLIIVILTEAKIRFNIISFESSPRAGGTTP
jgi:hypothetical protein